MQNDFCLFSCLNYGNLGDAFEMDECLAHFDRNHSHILSGGQIDSHQKQIQRNKMINAHAQNSIVQQ